MPPSALRRNIGSVPTVRTSLSRPIHVRTLGPHIRYRCPEENLLARPSCSSYSAMCHLSLSPHSNWSCTFSPLFGTLPYLLHLSGHLRSFFLRGRTQEWRRRRRLVGNRRHGWTGVQVIRFLPESHSSHLHVSSHVPPDASLRYLPPRSGVSVTYLAQSSRIFARNAQGRLQGGMFWGRGSKEGWSEGSWGRGQRATRRVDVVEFWRTMYLD